MPSAKQFSARALETTSAYQPGSASPPATTAAPISTHFARDTPTNEYERHESTMPPSACWSPRNATVERRSESVEIGVARGFSARRTSAHQASAATANAA